MSNEVNKSCTAIITGASSGFGVDYAKEIISRYPEISEIWLIARREDRLKKLSEELKELRKTMKSSILINIIVADLTNKDDLLVLKKKIFAEKPNIRILINNAGFGKVGRFVDLDIDNMLNMIDLNVKAVVALTHYSLPFMEKGSKIINVSSSASFMPLPFFNIYAATKTFVLNFSYALKVELEKRNISVIAVCPGPAETEFFEIQGSVTTKGANIAKSIDVVRLSLRDLDERKFVSVYGWQMKLVNFLSGIIPRSIMTRIAGKVKTVE